MNVPCRYMATAHTCLRHNDCCWPGGKGIPASGDVTADQLPCIYCFLRYTSVRLHQTSLKPFFPGGAEGTQSGNRRMHNHTLQETNKQCNNFSLTIQYNSRQQWHIYIHSVLTWRSICRQISWILRQSKEPSKCSTLGWDHSDRPDSFLEIEVAFIFKSSCRS